MAYALLPKEILLEIFGYLNVADLLACSCVCRHWYAVTLDPCLGKKVVFLLTEDASVGMATLKNSRRPVQHLVLKEVDVQSNGLSFWKSVGPNLTRLDFHSCDIAERLFVEILATCSSLKTLNIVGCNSLFISGTLLEKCLDLDSACLTVPSVNELSIASNRYLSDALFKRLLKVLPGVEKFSLEGCQITFHPGIYKRFYPPGQREQPSRAVLTFQVVTDLFEQNQRQICSMDFSRTLIDNGSLKKLVTMQAFQLEELYLVSCEQLTHAGIQFMCENLPGLKVLDLSLCYQLLDQSVICICQNLRQLRRLRLKRCHNLTDKGIREISSLVYLKQLDLSSCEKVTPEGFKAALSACTGLNELNLSYCNVSDDVLNLGRQMNLYFLDLSYCLAISDDTMQLVLSTMCALRHLRLAWCKALTSQGLCGLVDPVVSQDVIRTFDVPVVLTSRSPYSGHESNGLPNYEVKTQSPKKCSTPKTLMQLKCLRHLDLCGCVNIGNLGFTMGIRNVELKYLNLSLCHQLTDGSLISISSENPSLETLILSQCHQLTDSGITSALWKLPRLKYVDLQGCRQLTDCTLRAIRNCSRDLRYLNITLCPLMTSDAVMNLEIDLTKLQTIHK